MKSIPLSLRFIFVFALAGFFFSGYLAFVKLFYGACAFNETCPTVFRIPACWFGFAFFVTLLTLTVQSARNRIDFGEGIRYIALGSFLGVLFAGYLTLTELPQFVTRGFTAYTFGVPTCFLGLVFFMLIFVTAALSWSHDRERNR